MISSHLMLPVVLVIVAGAMLSTQAMINTRLASELNSALLASTISFGVGFLVLLVIYLLKEGVGSLTISIFESVTPFLLLGGFLGAAYVTTVIYAVPKIGVTSTFVFVIIGQLFVALLIDHFSLLGITYRAWDVPRTLGAIFVVVGAVLIFKRPV